MATEAVLLYALGMPLIGAGFAWTVTLLSVQRARERGGDLHPRTRGRVMVFMALPATLVLFGFNLWFLSGTVPDARVAELSALVYGVSALLAGAGEAVVFGRGTAAMLRDESAFLRVVVFAALSEVAALHGFTVGFFIQRAAQAAAGDVAGPLAGLEAGAVLCLLAAAAAAVSGVLGTSAEGWTSPAGLYKGLGRASPVLALSVVLFVAALLAL